MGLDCFNLLSNYKCKQYLDIHWSSPNTNGGLHNSVLNINYGKTWCLKIKRITCYTSMNLYVTLSSSMWFISNFLFLLKLMSFLFWNLACKRPEISKSPCDSLTCQERITIVNYVAQRCICKRFVTVKHQTCCKLSCIINHNSNAFLDTCCSFYWLSF